MNGGRSVWTWEEVLERSSPIPLRPKWTVDRSNWSRRVSWDLKDFEGIFYDSNSYELFYSSRLYVFGSKDTTLARRIGATNRTWCVYTSFDPVSFSTKRTSQCIWYHRGRQRESGEEPPMPVLRMCSVSELEGMVIAERNRSVPVFGWTKKLWRNRSILVFACWEWHYSKCRLIIPKLN